MYDAKGAKEEIRALMRHTDKIPEIQNMIRVGTLVTLRNIEMVNLRTFISPSLTNISYVGCSNNFIGQICNSASTYSNVLRIFL